LIITLDTNGSYQILQAAPYVIACLGQPCDEHKSVGKLALSDVILPEFFYLSFAVAFGGVLNVVM